MLNLEQNTENQKFIFRGCARVTLAGFQEGIAFQNFSPPTSLRIRGLPVTFLSEVEDFRATFNNLQTLELAGGAPKTIRKRCFFM